MGGALSRNRNHIPPETIQVLAVAVGIVVFAVVNSADTLKAAIRAFSALPLKDQMNLAAILLGVVFAAAALVHFRPTVPVKARRSAQDFLKAIVEKEPEPVPESDGMFVMRGVVKLETGVRSDVVIRKVTHPFWQACIDTVDRPPPPSDYKQADSPNRQIRVCAVGTPGVGKTTCTPYLIMMLLKDKKTVVYHVRSQSKNRFVYEFIPGLAGTIASNVYPEQNWETTIRSLKDPSTYYIVDPGKFNGSCDPDDDFLPKVIIVASPDSKHWGGSEFYKTRDGGKGVLKFFPVWELNEILEARQVVGPKMTVEEVEMRYGHVGGVPRDIFDDDEGFKEALRRQDKAGTLLSMQQVKDVSVRFDVEAIVDDTFDASQPKSALIGYRVSDYDKGTFSDYIVEVIATHAFARIVRRFMVDMWQDLLLPSAGNPWLFEIYTRYLIASKSTRVKYRRGVGKRNVGRGSVKTIALGGGCTEVRSAGDIVEAAKKRHMVLFHSAKVSHPLIDFIYRTSKGHFHAFQVTLGPKHSAKVCHIRALERLVGSGSKLSLYYLVPESRFDEFVTDPVDPRAEGASCCIYHIAIPDPRQDKAV
jgi:hypothetical protein